MFAPVAALPSAAAAFPSIPSFFSALCVCVCVCVRASVSQHHAWLLLDTRYTCVDAMYKNTHTQAHRHTGTHKHIHTNTYTHICINTYSTYTHIHIESLTFPHTCGHMVYSTMMRDSHRSESFSTNLLILVTIFMPS